MKCVLLLNPKSRSGEEAAPVIRRGLERAGATLAGGEPKLPQQLAQVLAENEGAPVDRILVAGGDGTLNKSLPTLLEASLPVAILPLGTANDLAHSLGIPSETAAALDVALSGRIEPIDVASVNGSPFLNVATIGLGPKVTQHLTSELKARLGFLGYPWALLSAYRESRPFRVRITCPDQPPARLRCLHFAVGNGRFYGGGAVVGQDTWLNDGLLNVVVLKPKPLWRLLLQVPFVGLGHHRHAPDVRAFQASSLLLETNHTKRISADGEILTETPARFEVRPGALHVVVPKDVESPGLRAAPPSGDGLE